MDKQYTIFDQINEMETQERTKERKNESSVFSNSKDTISDHNGNTYIIDKKSRKVLSYRDKRGFIYTPKGELKGHIDDKEFVIGLDD